MTTSPILLSPSGSVQGLKLRRQRLLSAVDKDPRRVLDDRRCLKPDFCLQYFDLCDARALECDRRALEKPDLVLQYAETGVLLAKKIGNCHLVHRSLDTLIHAHIAVEQPAAALALLEELRVPAERCCSSCHAGWLRRYGDYLNEIREGAHADEFLSRSLAKIDNLDLAERTRFVRGISHHYRGARDLALEDEASVLEHLPLTAPRGYFLDAIAILAVLLKGAEPHHDEWALAVLTRFEARLTGVKYWTSVHTRVRWVVGQLLARLGDVRGALDRLDSVRRELLETGPIRHAVAATADQALLHCKSYHQESLRVLETMVAACERYRLKGQREGREEPDPLLEHQLEAIAKTLERRPEIAYDAFVALRSSFVVPVPGIISARPGFLPEGFVSGAW